LIRSCVSFTALVLLLFALAVPAQAQEADFVLGRFLTCKKVVDREPVGITLSFPEETVKVYAFIEALEVKKETELKIQWLFEGKQTATIELTLGKSKRWRTFSSKRIGIRRGNWEVRLLDREDKLLRSLNFTVK
jgi:hypothetical protein